ncbi:MAG: AraC family transcriptional regulator [Spirochaetia bacterium]|nr:AraC family transcriptional regulator [Spirochaetia bacterium]
MKQFLIWDNFATYRGEGFVSGRHSHYFIQISLPDSGIVQLRSRDGEWKTYGAAVVPAGLSHEMRGAEGNLTLLYLDPMTTGYHLFHDRSLRAKQTVFEVGDFFTDQMKDQIKHALTKANKNVRAEILEILNQNSSGKANRDLDPRIRKSISNAQLEDFLLPRLAAEAALSVERYRHLFREETGVPFSAYRLWLKTKKAVDYLANNTHLLDAAHEGGFADQSHFTRIFRRSFGVGPGDFTKKKDPFTAIFFSE